ncbi:NAD(P)H-dependent oxidoreductase [Mesorhizobium sp. B3-1-3]|uniref:NADPH-dependent FMN reductase n=1 Tax=unclassified Mesorhizobium TaxID=325217 RepID=UPI00112A0E59|nr:MULTISPECIES: NAD(P)H-dependent oxidoreductase [unclassified Mesorhizobium]TPI64849.1 NAD(P)H-dependent oxidoreductase [Mesorhizobium sp. B3-1-3]TPI69641.1 NAD(P)H-dependent oxidoreductase [Mesorhizobium sp. B3-1-8]
MSSGLGLVVIIGSTREGRRGDKVARWFVSEATRHAGFDIDVIDLADIRLPTFHPASRGSEMQALAGRLEAADAFVIVTPEYNHSFPGHLKHAIDQADLEWRGKPVGFVSYGGTSGGLRAVEHLRQVFAELHAVSVRDCISFHGVWDEFDENGALKDIEGRRKAADNLLDHLCWWAAPLRDARRSIPYGTRA